MIGTRWRKVAGDLRTERGRAALMIAAVALSLFGIGAVLGAYSILMREMPRNYLGTRPASAALEIDAGVEPNLVEKVRQRPGVAEAEAGEIVVARAKVGDDWIQILLFVVSDFEKMRLNTFDHEEGTWPPPEGTMLIERTAGPMLQAALGDEVLVKPPHGSVRALKITGIVHDPGLAPAWQEQEGYGYITPRTLELLGEPAHLGELRVAFEREPYELKAVERQTQELTHWLESQGVAVSQARIPPPGKHPHQGQMTGVIFLLLAFSGLGLLLSGILVATSVSAMLSRQLRELGVMKTIGGRTPQIFILYAAFVAVLSAISLAIAVPTGILGARALSNMVGRMLNFTLESQAVPLWVLAVQVAAGFLVPFAVAALPILRTSRLTVRQALEQHGARIPAKEGRTFSALAASGWLDRVTLLSIRNALRRRTRLLLTVGLLTAGGALFLSALNTARAWESISARVFENRSYDVEIRLDTPATDAARLKELPGIRTLEAWGYSRTALYKPGEIDVVRSYPDGSHGSFALMAPPPETELVKFPLIAGRWLRADDEDAVVLNHLAVVQSPRTKVGDHISLSLHGKPTVWKVVGIVEEVGSPAVAYVPQASFARASGEPDRVQMLRIATTAKDPTERTEMIRAIDRHLGQNHVSVESVVPLTMLRTAMGDHVIILIRLLLAMAGLMLIVGLLGLGSVTSTNVLERSREIGILKTIGATPSRIVQLVMTEAWIAALLSFGTAVLVSVPLSAAIGSVVGKLAFRLQLPLQIVPEGIALWFVLALAVASVAAWLPARRAARMTIWKALAQV